MSADLDDATLEMLTDVVSKTWEALPPEYQMTTTKEEIARVAMLIALAGKLDPTEIMSSILYEFHRSSEPNHF